jgi:hypothetical protein
MASLRSVSLSWPLCSARTASAVAEARKVWKSLADIFAPLASAR